MPYVSAFGNGICIQEAQHLGGCRRGTEIASRCCAESVVCLAHNGDVQTRGGHVRRGLRAVVGDHDLQEISRVVLQLQCGQHQRELGRLLVVGDDDTDRDGTRVERVEEIPPIARHDEATVRQRHRSGFHRCTSRRNVP